MKPTLTKRNFSKRGQQRGVVLFVALIVLVAMSLAGISMMRSVDAGNKIAGNLAQRQSATNAAEFAFEQAMVQVAQLAVTGLGTTDNPSIGYSSSYQNARFFERNWDAAWTFSADPTTGNTVAVLIDRMCLGTSCQYLMSKTSNVDGVSHSSPGVIPVSREPYRILARVTSPQGMVTYLEEKIY
jgi:type IV pilus assembly protein PilX